MIGTTEREKRRNKNHLDSDHWPNDNFLMNSNQKKLHPSPSPDTGGITQCTCVPGGQDRQILAAVNTQTNKHITTGSNECNISTIATHPSKPPLPIPVFTSAATLSHWSLDQLLQKLHWYSSVALSSYVATWFLLSKLPPQLTIPTTTVVLKW